MKERSIEELLKREREQVWDETQRHHADLVIGLLRDMAAGNIEACLDIARHEFKMTEDTLWLRVRDGLLHDLKLQSSPLFVAPPPPIPDDELPF